MSTGVSLTRVAAPARRDADVLRDEPGARGRLVVSASTVGVVAFLVSVLGSWIPSFWGDEAATIMSAERSLPALLNELGSVDAVHGAYYALMHVWIDVFGSSPLATRFPSALAVGLAAAGIVVLVQRQAGLRLAVIAAAVFAVLPRTTYMGLEVRSYALGTACAVWLTVLFLRLVERRSRRWMPWAGFAVGYAGCIYLFMYLALLALPFAAVLFWMSRSRLREIVRAVVRSSSARREAALLKATWVRWLAATVAGVMLASPLIAFGYAERQQIAFLGKHPGVDFLSFTVTQWFDSDWGLAIVAWSMLLGLVAAGGTVLLRRARGAVRTLPSRRATLLVVATAWFAPPPLALLALNAFTPAYTVRYMSFTTPALAILLAVAIDGAVRWAAPRWVAAHWAGRWWARWWPVGLRGAGSRRGASARRAAGRTAVVGAAEWADGIPNGATRRAGFPTLGAWWRSRSAVGHAGAVASLIAVALVAAVAVPGYLAQRGPYAMNGGSDWAEVAAVIGQHSRPGDDIVFDETARPSRRPRLAMHLYPAQFANVVDATLTVPYTERAGLWDSTESITAAGDRLHAGDGRVWLVEYRGPNKDGVVTSTGMEKRMSELRGLGFSLDKTYTLHRDVVYLFTEGATS